ncbi:hypothetical protein [Undibacterium sp.]|uniref:hypothetical protein n=1 Tax=Undibacterium sp. TaxID=1914977 RepID=UPI003753AEC8
MQTDQNKTSRSTEQVRLHVATTLKTQDLHLMSADGLTILQQQLGLGDQWGQFKFPKECLPISHRGGSSINLKFRLESAASSVNDLDLAILTLVRMTLLCFLTPSQAGRHAPRLLDISTISSNLSSIWFPIIKLALERPDEKNGILLGRISRDDLKHVSYIREMNRFENYTARGLWSDSIGATVKLSQEEGSNKTSRKTKISKKKSDPFKPLPDVFIHEVGRRAAWLTTNLTPSVMEAFEEIIIIRKEQTKRGTMFLKRAREYLIKKSWRTLDSESLECLPFEIQCAKKTLGRPMNWPPRSVADLTTILAICQMAHYFIVALSAGSRASEILSFRIDCLSETSEGNVCASGKTYKLVERIGGEKRDWPMPQLAIKALQNQIRLSKLINEYISVDPKMAIVGSTGLAQLWRIIGTSHIGKPLGVTYNIECRWFVHALGLSHLIDDQPLTNHRFRKTIARLVALSLVHAPKILMDVFGHKSIEMTMSYILADPNFRAEVQEVRKELVILMARNAIEKVDLNGGRAAVPLKQIVNEIKFRRGSEYGADDENQLAEMLTGQGRFWQWVRPGVMCTKLPDQTGPCTKKQSTPNPARCDSQCDYRLEQSENRKQVDETIGDIVFKIKYARARDEFVLAELWEGQLLTHLRRFEDLRLKWSQDSVVNIVLKRAEKSEDVKRY